MKNKVLRFTAAGFMTAFVFTLALSFLPMFLPTARAAGSNTDDLQKYVAYRSIVACFGNNKSGDFMAGDDKYVANVAIRQSDLANWKDSFGNGWFNSTVYLDTEGNKDGYSSCESIIEKAMGILSLSTDSMFAALGYKTYLKDNEVVLCFNTDSCNPSILHALSDSNLALARDKFKAAMQSKGIPTEMTDIMRALSAGGALMQACNARPQNKDQADPNIWTQSANFPTSPDYSSKYQRTHFYDGNVAYDALLTLDDRNLLVGAYPDLNSNNKFRDMDRSKCADLVADMNKNSKAWLEQAYRDHKNKLIELTGEGLAAEFCKTETSGGNPDVMADCIKKAKDAAGFCINLALVQAGQTLGNLNKIDSATVSKCIAERTGFDETKTNQIVSQVLASNSFQNDPPGAGNTDADPCKVIPDGTPMRWLACSVFTAISAMTSAMEGFLTDMMYTDTSSAGEANIFNNQGFSAAANTFRTISLVIIFIAGLIMVISQALGLDILDAYTIKKLLPRVGVALVGIALAWPLLKTATSLSNDLALATGEILDGLAATTGTGSAGGIGGGIGGFFAAAIGSTAVIASLGFWGAFLLILSLLVSFITALIVLATQKILLYALILAAPLAIAASVLPGTDKLWKMWRSNIIKLFAMFLIIILIIKVGDFMAAVAMGAEAVFIGIVAKIASLVMTFKAPQLAGQMMGGVAGMVSSVGYNLAGRAKAPIDKTRQANTKQRNQQMAEGSRFRNTSAVGRRMNAITRGAALVPQALQKGGLLNPNTFSRQLQAADAQSKFDKANELRSKNADFMSGMNDDAVLWSVIRGGKGGIKGVRDELIAQGKKGVELETATAQAERMLNSGDLKSVQIAAAMQQASTGTGYKDVGEMLSTIADVSDGDRTLGKGMIGAMRGAASQSGRFDLGGAGFGATAGVLDEIYDNGPNAESGRYTASKSKVRMLQRDALNSVDANTLARQRGESSRNLSIAAQEFINGDSDSMSSLTGHEDGKRNAYFDANYTWNSDQNTYVDSAGNPVKDYTPANREESIAQSKARMAATLENMHMATKNYGATARTHEVHSVGMDTTGPQRKELHGAEEYQEHVSSYNPNSREAQEQARLLRERRDQEGQN